MGEDIEIVAIVRTVKKSNSIVENYISVSS
jgi:hypothetical protein